MTPPKKTPKRESCRDDARPFPPLTSIHSLSNPHTSQHQSSHTQLLQPLVSILPPPTKKLRVDNASMGFSTMPVEVPVEMPNNYNLDFAFTELTTDLVSNNPVAMPGAPAASGVVVGPASAPPLSESLFENVVPLAQSAMATAVGDASQVSATGTHGRLLAPIKPIDRLHPPSSPLSSGSGNLATSQSVVTPIGPHPHTRRDPLHSAPLPGAQPMHTPSSYTHLMHSGQAPGARAALGNAPTPYVSGASASGMPPVAVQQQHQQPQHVNHISLGGIDVGGSGLDDVSQGMGRSAGLGAGLGKEGGVKQEGQLVGASHSKMSQEQYQKRQADRAARNRESSRRAREKAKHRFRSLEQETASLRETVRTLQVQNNYLQAQVERANAIQQACHLCRFKTSGNVAPQESRGGSMGPPGPLMRS